MEDPNLDLEDFLQKGDITYNNIKELLNNVDFNEENEFRRTPFVNIAMNPNINVEIVELILQHGGDPNIKSYHDGTVLHNILQNRELKNNQDMMYKIIEILLEYDADVNATDSNGITPISFITQYTNIDVVRLLLEAGANLNLNRDFLPLYDI